MAYTGPGRNGATCSASTDCEGYCSGTTNTCVSCRYCLFLNNALEGTCPLKCGYDAGLAAGGFASCDCKVNFKDRLPQAFIVNMVMIVAVLVPYGLLIVYCILFKSGKFNGLAAEQDYIESCQSVQNSVVFRTYCNILAFVCVAVIGYGLFEAQIGTGDDSEPEDNEPEYEADQQATQNLIVAGLVSGLSSPVGGSRV